jgi:uncharacterized protein YceK
MPEHKSMNQHNCPGFIHATHMNFDWMTLDTDLPVTFAFDSLVMPYVVVDVPEIDLAILSPPPQASI